MRTMNNIETFRNLINTRLKELLSKYNVSDKLNESMSYSVNAGGKRIRPLIPILMVSDYTFSDDVAGGLIDCACAIEFIHTYSLIHDDLPAMDDSCYRRNILTNHKVFGEALAILAGDALLTESFNIISQANLDDAVKVKMIQTLATSAGANGMVAGQSLDILNDNITNIEQLNTINYHKTHDLISASFLFGAYYLKFDDEKIIKIKKCAELFGLAFQIKDDLLDILTSRDEIGKDINKDQDNNKGTYPSILGIEKSKELVNKYKEEALSIIEELFGNKSLYEVIKSNL